MDKKTELELLRKYAEIRRLYEQTNTLSVLMGEFYTADLTSSYFTDEIRQLAGKIAPDAYRLKTLLTTVEHQLLTQLTESQFTLRLPLEKVPCATYYWRPTPGKTSPTLQQRYN